MVFFDQLLHATLYLHIHFAPYTKVEESFNLHAAHDILMYGVGPASLSHYDHVLSPGAVPRTFFGTILLTSLSKVFLYLSGWMGYNPSKLDLQLVVRLALATANAFALRAIRSAVSHRFTSTTGWLFVLLTCTQFHLPFWMGRTIPNMFALIPVNFAWYLILDEAPNARIFLTTPFYAAVSLLVFTTVVFRSEVLLLLGPLVLQALWHGHATIGATFRVGIISGLVSLAITICVDSYFWNQWPLWPELVGIYFNVFQGKSSEWGVSPFHVYFSTYLPRLLLGSFPLSIIGSLVDHRIRFHLLSPVIFVFLMSFLGHKEWRFIIYVVPMFNVAAARGATWLISVTERRIFRRILSLFLTGVLIANLLVTILLTRASVSNYPGGQALAAFNNLYGNETHVHVHISNLAAQSGASLFLYTHSPPYYNLTTRPPPSFQAWVYDKTQSLSLQALTDAKEITHMIAEAPCPTPQSGWHKVLSVHGFKKWHLDRNIIRQQRSWTAVGQVLRLVTEEKLCILYRGDVPDT